MYFVEKSKGVNFWKQFDYVVFISVLLLSAFGLIVLSSATKTMPGGDKMMLMQVIGMGIGIIAALVISSIDYSDLKSLGILFYLACIVLLVLVLFIGTGDSIGSRSWIRFGPVGLQPSEPAKIALIILAAAFLERIKDNGIDGNNVIKLLLYSLLPIALIIAEKDFGTTMVFIFILFVMLFIAGIPYKYIAALSAAFLASLPFVWFFVLNDKRKDRIRVFLDPELDPLNAGMNVIRSKLAIGSGQIYGKGLYNGLLTQNGAVPVRESDFIFSAIGEELGFIGCCVVVVMFFFLLIRSLYIARNSRDYFGTFLVIGITAMFAFHVIENIGMGLGLLPVTGVPLPFISAGASAVVTNYMAVGILLSVSMRRKRTIFNSTE